MRLRAQHSLLGGDNRLPAVLAVLAPQDEVTPARLRAVVLEDVRRQIAVDALGASKEVAGPPHHHERCSGLRPPVRACLPSPDA